jgi:hypothetical protein
MNPEIQSGLCPACGSERGTTYGCSMCESETPELREIREEEESSPTRKAYYDTIRRLGGDPVQVRKKAKRMLAEEEKKRTPPLPNHRPHDLNQPPAGKMF